MNQSKVLVGARLVLRYWDLIPMVSGAELFDLKDTGIVRVSEEIPEANKWRSYWWTK